MGRQTSGDGCIAGHGLLRRYVQGNHPEALRRGWPSRYERKRPSEHEDRAGLRRRKPGRRSRSFGSFRVGSFNAKRVPTTARHVRSSSPANGIGKVPALRRRQMGVQRRNAAVDEFQDSHLQRGAKAFQVHRMRMRRFLIESCRTLVGHPRQLESVPVSAVSVCECVGSLRPHASPTTAQRRRHGRKRDRPVEGKPGPGRSYQIPAEVEEQSRIPVWANHRHSFNDAFQFED